jgi:hypothetical protein
MNEGNEMVPKRVGAIYRLLAEAQSKMGPVVMRGYNAHHGYPYTKLDDVMVVVHPVIKTMPMLVIHMVMEVKDLPPRTTRAGGVEHVVRILGETRAIAAEDGSYVGVPWTSQSQSGDDKADFKAMTGGMKYGMCMLFKLASVDDPEADESVGNTMGRPQSGRPVPSADPQEPEAEFQETVIDEPAPQVTMTPRQRLAYGLHAMLRRSMPDATPADAMKMFGDSLKGTKLNDAGIDITLARLSRVMLENPSMTLAEFCRPSATAPPATQMPEF